MIVYLLRVQQINIQTYIHTYIHIYIHTYIHTYIHYKLLDIQNGHTLK